MRRYKVLFIVAILSNFLVIALMCIPFLYRMDGIVIRISADDSDRRRLITVIKRYIPEDMIETIFSADVQIVYQPSIPYEDDMCIAGYVRGNKVVLIENADLVTILHELTHVYDAKTGYSDSAEFLSLYDKYEGTVLFRFRTNERDIEYVADSNKEFFAECYAYYLVGDLKCDELERYFESLKSGS